MTETLNLKSIPNSKKKTYETLSLLIDPSFDSNPKHLTDFDRKPRSQNDLKPKSQTENDTDIGNEKEELTSWSERENQMKKTQ